MHSYTAKYVVSILIHKDGLLEYAKEVGGSNYMPELLDAQEDLNRILKALNNMDEKQREYIDTYIFSGLKQTEMAEKLNTKQPNVKRNFLRSVEKLVKILNNPKNRKYGK